MALTPKVVTTSLTVPVYTRVNGQEIELGTCEIEVPVRITIHPTSQEEASCEPSP